MSSNSENHQNNSEDAQGNRKMRKRIQRRKPGKPEAKRKVTQRKKTLEEKEGTIRLNKYIANCGVCSRREADKLITNGEITVNGEVNTSLGSRVSNADNVEYQGKALSSAKKVYILLNKPKDTITTTDDPEGRRTVMDLVDGSFDGRVYPVGRLDRNTTGVLFFTNDGELAQRLIHPKRNIKKVYAVQLDRELDLEDLYKLEAGVKLKDGVMKPDKVAYTDPENQTKVGVEIHSGKNRIIHRMFNQLGYNVDKLDRVLFAEFDKRKLKRGDWRLLSDKEIKSIKLFVGIKD
jgi:23S rRNA pseudouridine2605 synthase